MPRPARTARQSPAGGEAVKMLDRNAAVGQQLDWRLGLGLLLFRNRSSAGKPPIQLLNLAGGLEAEGLRDRIPTIHAESDDPVSAIASCADAHNEMRHFPLSAAEKTSSLPVFLPSHSWKSRQRASNRSGNAASVRVISHSSYPITRARRQDIVHGGLPFRGNGKGKPPCVFSWRNR